MKKLLLTLMLITASSNVMAEWVEIESNETDTFYADPATIRKTGNIVRMWVLTDYKTVQTNASKPYMSKLGVRKYDCKEKQSRATIKTLHSKNMGVGKYVGIIGNRPWLPVSPRTTSELLWKFACGR
jgi:hypothetical protein